MNSKESGATLTEDCAAYFKRESAYHGAFVQMREKWRKYGRAAGVVRMDSPKEEERAAYGRFFGKDYAGMPIKFTMAEFEGALQETRFRGVSLGGLLEAYFQEALTTNKEERNREREEREHFFHLLCKRTEAEYGKDSPVSQWAADVCREKKHGYHLILAEYDKSPDAAADTVGNVCRAIGILEKEKRVRLAVLGAEVTRNPHAFDRNTTAGKLLLKALGYIYHAEEVHGAEDILMLYYTSGIQPDDISSFTAVYGIRFFTEAGEHPAYRSFVENSEPFVMTLSNLNKITGARPDGGKVYVVENQMVFSHLCEELRGKRVSLVCTSGQMKTASLILLDLLCRGGGRIYYSGDFDPNGIQIADRILARLPGCAEPWHMTKEDYECAISGEGIGDRELCKLAKVGDPRLAKVRDAVLERKKAGYQERLIGRMLEDIWMEGE